MLEYSGYSLQLTCLVVPWHAAQCRCSSLGRAGRRPVTEAPLGLPYLATRLKAPRAAVRQENRSRLSLLRVETVGLQQPQRGKPEGQPAAPFSGRPARRLWLPVPVSNACARCRGASLRHARDAAQVAPSCRWPRTLRYCLRSTADEWEYPTLVLVKFHPPSIGPCCTLAPALFVCSFVDRGRPVRVFSPLQKVTTRGFAGLAPPRTARSVTAGVASLAPTRCVRTTYMDAKFGGEDADMAEAQRS